MIVTDTLPPDKDAQFLTATTTKGSCRQRRGVVTCELGTLGSGERATVTVVVRPITNVASLSNAAEVSGAVNDPNPANNKEVEETTVVAGR